MDLFISYVVFDKLIPSITINSSLMGNFLIDELLR